MSSGESPGRSCPPEGDAAASPGSTSRCERASLRWERERASYRSKAGIKLDAASRATRGRDTDTREVEVGHIDPTDPAIPHGNVTAVARDLSSFGPYLLQISYLERRRTVEGDKNRSPVSGSVCGAADATDNFSSDVAAGGEADGSAVTEYAKGTDMHSSNVTAGGDCDGAAVAAYEARSNAKDLTSSNVAAGREGDGADYRTAGTDNIAGSNVAAGGEGDGARTGTGEGGAAVDIASSNVAAGGEVYGTSDAAAAEAAA